jgi:NAD(P)-dependent dehydrogenase (short-subunit alcohol dehydrogenase family)
MSYQNTILITGGTLGLGYACALYLARLHPTSLIVLASRSDSNAAATINTTLQQKNTVFLPIDLSDPSNVRSFSSAWPSKKFPPIQSLILNAGLQFPGKAEFNATRIEKSFAINHLGNTLLFFLLRPYLVSSARTVFVASGTHDPLQKTGLKAVYNSAEEVAHPSEEAKKASGGRDRYATSKLCNVLFTYALARRLDKEGQGRTVVAFDPGLMPATGLVREAALLIRFLAHYVLPRALWVLRHVGSGNVHTPEESGAALAEVAMPKADEVKVNGVYFQGVEQIKSSVVSYDVAKQEDLWSWTVLNLSVNEEEKQKFEEF